MTKEGEEVAIAIDLDALQEAVAALESELNEDSEEEISEDQEEIDLSEEDLMKTIADVVAELSTGDDLDVLDEVDKDGDGAPAAPKWSREPGKKLPNGLTRMMTIPKLRSIRRN